MEKPYANRKMQRFGNGEDRIYFIAIIVIVFLLELALVLTLGGEKEKLDKDSSNDIIMHDSDEDTVEDSKDTGTGGILLIDTEEGKGYAGILERRELHG